jgi:hypothetical protein
MKEPRPPIVAARDGRGRASVEAPRPHRRHDRGNRLLRSLAARATCQNDSSPMLGDTGEPYGSRGGFRGAAATLHSAVHRLTLLENNRVLLIILAGKLADYVGEWPNNEELPAGGYSSPGRLFSARERISHAWSAIYRRPARLEVQATFEIPSAFLFSMPGRSPRTCKVIWRTDRQLGVDFR